jgi:hypothetical protein
MHSTSAIWSDKVSNIAQVGGIETSVLDNGLGKGVRIAWINTGTGLRFKVVIDRAMDIADAFFNQYSLSWLNHPGVVAPQPFSNRGTDWLRTFGGGLITTCGLSHVGGPEQDEHGERGLHGLISNISAEVVSIIQPDPARGIFSMSITGIIKQTQIFGPSLELKRTISATLGSSIIHLHDEIINRGNETAPHMLLYHCNFGWPLADEGAQIFCNGEKTISCPTVSEKHNGSGQDVFFIDSAPNKEGICVCGIENKKIGLAAVLKFPKKQLPWLTNWQHWAKGEYVTGIEPGTHPPIGQAKAREEGSLIFIAPGEPRAYDLEIDILNNQEAINKIIQQTTLQ